MTEHTITAADIRRQLRWKAQHLEEENNHFNTGVCFVVFLWVTITAAFVLRFC